ncbi:MULTISPECIES: 3-isopropylmalate dehydratase large subunit [unclassified Novosphingobium]|uniref:3-isopropylmalate dehydratase large subunit n=1 Tax=unclassified Novosphingobium TaxID=2644732 RepID=UPI00086CCE3B|nr:MULTISPECIES: 3-isopropylmalate dehydratase large subunit [unclassified Novosphingobium]MDR6707256.1 3-isopropylmalate/(R)-2-methylmalate dehydratase large subunit [Novosphingobium sp. 1748]ODU82792.1 MAG: 3-isopropylmalate dehydratase [Novosphingobium sp. SCN 63-17]OJX96497.1 MAG: 3-isopropylmalate dehydratase [Novosphingobium sp. 63-713]
MARTLADKIWDAHVTATTPAGSDLVAIDRVFLHERTGASALKNMAAAGRPVVDPARVFAVMDHIVDTRPGRGDQTLMQGGQAFITETRAAAMAAGITLFDVTDPDQGITHVISPELGIVLPGCTLVAPDSHTCTQGALGALAWGIGSSEAEHAMATGVLRLPRPKTMLVRFDGALRPGVTAKDMALALIAAHGAGGGAGHVVEFAGSAVLALDIEARMTLCNMATEFAAMAAIIAPDEKTYAYLTGRRYAPAAFDAPYWACLHSDEGAQFDRTIVIDASAITPMITWGTSPEHAIPVDGVVPGGPARAHDYIGLAAGAAILGTPIDVAFIGSCTNARLSDLRRAAALAKGRHIAPSIQKALVVPGSSAVKRAAEAEGLDKIFEAAGFEWRMSGCSLCFFAGGESFPAGSRSISSTNRNFEGRQGPGIRTHIASPEVVVASAIAGAIADPRDLEPQA